MTAIYDLPNDPPTNAGLEFNYSVWVPGTIATFCNVRWNGDYRDIVIFDNQSELNDHIDSTSSANLTITEMSYARPGNPIRVNLPLSRMMKYNYVRVTNPAQPIAGDSERHWYYFITDVRHLSPNTTEIFVQLDVIQSFVYGLELGRCYIDRGHLGIANENQMADNGRRFLTVPEGFDLGGEYQVDRLYSYVAGTANPLESHPGYQVVIMSTVDLTESGGTIDNPELTTATGSNSQRLESGASLYVATSTGFANLMNHFKTKPWVTQGIIGVWMFPEDYYIHRKANPIPNVANVWPIEGAISEPVEHALPGLKDWRNTPVIRKSRYAHLKKFLTYPYSFFELTTYTGTPIVLKPESWQDDDGTIVALPHYTPPSMRVAYYPKGYNSGLLTNNTWRMYGIGRKDDPVANHTFNLNIDGEFLDMATFIIDMPSVPLVNDSYLAYMASNRNSIAFAHASADWSQQRAMEGNRVAYGQATSAMSTDMQQSLIQRQTASALNSVDVNRQINQFGISGVGNVLGGSVAGPAGALGGAARSGLEAASTAVNINAQNKSLALNNLANKNMMLNRLENASYMRDTNKQYADYAAQGDYQNAIAAINAKVQDAKLIQPTTSGQMGGESFLMANYKWGFDIKYKVIDDNVMAMIGEHWLRYGYALHRYYSIGDVRNLHCMDKFTYWKMLECNIISGEMPETFKQAIRGILEKGVTVWRNPLEIGSVDPATNKPVPGISLSL